MSDEIFLTIPLVAFNSQVYCFYFMMNPNNTNIVYHLPFRRSFINQMNYLAI